MSPDRCAIAVEHGFLPADAYDYRDASLASRISWKRTCRWSGCARARRPEELEFCARPRTGSSIRCSPSSPSHGPGSTKTELVEALRREEVNRGLTFEYCLITAGTSLNRAPSDQVWGEGDILSLDSGGNYKGYIGDLCRMAIQGEPDGELKDLLAEIDEIQMTSRKPIRAGAPGRLIYEAVAPLVERSSHGNSLEFVAHGMGLISHEAPRLSAHAPVPYPAYDADRPLESGMVVSIETTILHPRRGFIKLEDTVAVTDNGWEAFGDYGRGWNRGGLRRELIAGFDTLRRGAQASPSFCARPMR